MVCDFQASIVGHILRQCLRTVGGLSRVGFHTIIERNHHLLLLLELSNIGFVPSVVEVTIFVIIRTVIVESVCDFMCEHCGCGIAGYHIICR